jgi:uncharacterized membrane protein YbaN (DUF454 family)
MTARPPQNWKDVLRIVVGLVFLVLGVLGLFLPILQGILFLLVSGFLLAPFSPTIQRILDWARHRYPRLFARAHRFRERLRRRFRHHDDGD